jgi:hypothetical protein
VPDSVNREIIKLVLIGLLFVSTVSASVFATLTYEPLQLGFSNVKAEPQNDTLISAQGFLLEGKGSSMKPGRLVRANPDGSLRWKYNGSSEKQWFYDVEQVNSTHLFLTTRRDGKARAQLLTDEGALVWEESFDARDTHDIDFINSTHLLVAPMQKHYFEEGQREFSDRVFIYDRIDGEVDWNWRFSEHYEEPENFPRTGWTHLNDADMVKEDLIMASPRNFDRVIFINTTTSEVVETLGEQGNHEIINRQHNPDVLEWTERRKTVIVADSENDRIVEYTKTPGSDWTLSWKLNGSLNWPRDADRLPNGNTLISDTLNHRVIEVAPNGTVLWEFYAPWATYDAERMGTSEGSEGSTMRETGKSGEYTLNGGSVSSSTKVGLSHVCGDDRAISMPVKTSAVLERSTSGTLLEPVGVKAASLYEKYVPWIKPAWMSPLTLALLPFVIISGLGLTIEGYRNRQTLKEKTSLDRLFT